jgi:hypothetical protein
MLALTRRRTLGLLLGALVGGGCLAPTLPLPPPEKPTVEGPDQQGNVRLSGTTPEDGATVLSLNERTNQIAGQRTTPGSRYLLIMPAQTGDVMTFWYTVGNEVSPSIRFQIGNTVP